jgi:hypothetical protein
LEEIDELIEMPERIFKEFFKKFIPLDLGMRPTEVPTTSNVM